LFGQWLALPPTVIVLGRTTVAGLALAVVVAGQRLAWRPGVGLAGNGVILAIHWVTFFEAIQVSSVAIGLLGYAAFPLFVLALERVMLEGRFGKREALTTLLVSAGLLVLVPSFEWRDSVVQGLAWGLASAFTFALLAVRSRRYAATHAPSVVALWQNLFAAFTLAPFVWVGRAAIPAISPRDLLLIVVLGLACTALAHTLFIASLRRVSAHVASVVAALEPVYGIALAALLLHEIPTARTLVGAVLIVGAALYATGLPQRRRERREA
jgi:drug/metabolite transporter (DMT)-like permease